MRARSLFALPSALATLAFLSTTFFLTNARADDPPARSLVRLLRSPKKLVHPLADDEGRVAVSVTLPPGVDAKSLGLLPVAPGIGGIRLAPNDVDAFADAHPNIALTVSPPLFPLLDASKLWTRVEVFRQATGAGKGKGVIVGIVDTGLDVRHADFRDANGKSRVAWMLQSGRKPLGLHPAEEEAFGCNTSGQVPCAVFTGADLDAIMAGTLDAKLPNDDEGHGTHVTSIAAGNGGPMNGQPVYVGLAPEATLIVASPSSKAGFQDTDLLNATRFIFDRADAMQLPAVVNLSVGGDFGPHDGTSNLEKGLSAMVGDDKPGRAIVVAAGNSGALFAVKERGPFGIHTEARVTPHSVTRVPIATPKATKGKGFVWVTFRRGDEVSVGLEAPGGKTWIDLIEPGDEAGYDDGEGTTAAVINRLANGKAPITPDTNSAVIAFDGAWEEGSFAVLLEGKGDAQLWVTGQGDVSPSSSAGLMFEKAVRQGTIAVPASSPNLIAVGCTVNRVGWDPLMGAAIELAAFGGETNPKADSMCYFSAAGPNPFGVPKPDISAPGGFVAAAMSQDADPRTNPGGLFDGPGCPADQRPCFVVDQTHAITSGTSMAAPHVAGAIALLFELDLKERGASTLTQAGVTDLLQAGARWPTGTVRHETQLGPGTLDLEGARRAFYEDQAAQTPSVEKSWWILSSAYARPDLSWPVMGTVELRQDNGEVVTGIAGSQLEVSVTGGVLVQPATKVKNGLFRFAVAGEPGSAGTKMTVDVRYAGRSIETPRELPIGEDTWRANGTLGATSGGCGLPSSSTSSRSGPLGPTIGVALAGVVSLARRKRSSAKKQGR